MRRVYRSFAEAYKECLKECLRSGEMVDGVVDGNSVGSKFGRKIRATKELLSHHFTVEDPRNRSIISSVRNPIKSYQLANFLWTLTGDSNALRLMEFNSKGRQFLDDSGNLHSAIGPHLFKIHFDQFHEFDNLIELLRSDPSTRRAVIQLYQKSDLNAELKDVPCYNHIQFFLRDSKLHSVISMRSQSGLMVFPYDFFLFSMIQEAVAVRLNIDLGPIHYSVNSFHVYEDEFDLAEKVINTKIEESRDAKMETFDSSTVATLGYIFDKVANKLDYDESLLDSYWNRMIQKYFQNDVQPA